MPETPELKRVANQTLEALLPLAAVPLALTIGAVMLWLLKVNPLAAYGALVSGVVGSVFGVTQSLVQATPLLFVALGIVIAFRGGVLNIGAEGQITVGALAATAFALSLPHLPAVVMIPLCIIAGALAGAAWGGIPGFLKARLGVNEILSTIMMNQIAIQLNLYLLTGPMLDPAEVAAGTSIAQSALLPRAAWLPRLVPQTLLNAGTILALILAILVYIFMWRTTIGYRIRAVGLNPNASRYAGINVRIYQVLSLVLGGAFAGIAGAALVMGVQRRMIYGLSGGYGFTGIVVALFGQLHPLGAIPAAIIFGALLVGADQMQRTMQVPSAIVTVILGMIVLFVVSSTIFSRRRARKRQTHV
jgi:ABC-type uncharacterized transport system permease subunit